VENVHRSYLYAWEAAAAYAQLLADLGWSQEELASRIGRSRPQVSNTLRLLKLPPDVQRRVAAGVLSAGHARALLSLEDSAAMDRLAQRIVAEGLSVRAVEELILLGEADGKERTKTPRQRKKAKRDPALESVVNDVTELLQHALDTRVHIDGVTSKHSHARIVIECADIEDVQRVAGVISG
jgi:ParB family chromosome partitioning protein